jgi:hypothetical protein
LKCPTSVSAWKVYQVESVCVSHFKTRRRPVSTRRRPVISASQLPQLPPLVFSPPGGTLECPLRAPACCLPAGKARRSARMRSDCATIDPCRPSLSSARPLRVTSLLETDIHRSRPCALRASRACSGSRSGCSGSSGHARIGPVARIAIFGQMLMLCPHIHISGARVEVSPGGSLEYA